MPQVTLEYSRNIVREIDFQTLFDDLHKALADVGRIKIENCKSRAVAYDIFYVGQGEPGGAFVHLDVRFLEGRTPEMKQKIGEELLNILKRYYLPAPDGCDIQITVELNDIQRRSYFKHPGLSLRYAP